MPDPVVPFDTDDPEFTRGVQIGMLYATLFHAPIGFESYSCLLGSNNVEMARRVAKAHGWEVTTVRVTDEHGGQYPEYVEAVFSRITEESPYA